MTTTIKNALFSFTKMAMALPVKENNQPEILESIRNLVNSGKYGIEIVESNGHKYNQVFLGQNSGIKIQTGPIGSTENFVRITLFPGKINNYELGVLLDDWLGKNYQEIFRDNAITSQLTLRVLIGGLPKNSYACNRNYKNSSIKWLGNCIETQKQSGVNSHELTSVTNINAARMRLEKDVYDNNYYQIKVAYSNLKFSLHHINKNLLRPFENLNLYANEFLKDSSIPKEFIDDSIKIGMASAAAKYSINCQDVIFDVLDRYYLIGKISA